jgi:hypothetical protein
MYIMNNDVTGFTLVSNTVFDYKSEPNSEIYWGISVS